MVRQLIDDLCKKSLDTFDEIINNSDNVVVIKAAWTMVRELRKTEFVEYCGEIMLEKDMAEWRRCYDLGLSGEIETIKDIRRKVTGLSLREAKKFFDFHLFGRPMI